MDPHDDIEVGSKAPKFTAIDQDGDEFTSEFVAGMPFVLYFYPKDDTPGCTKEACSFRDNLEEIENRGITVIGVSPDDPESHQDFMEKHSLNYTLLADTDFQLCHLFDVLKANNGVERTTFIIDSKGIIRWIEKPVTVEGHIKRILKAIKDLDIE